MNGQSRSTSQNSTARKRSTSQGSTSGRQVQVRIHLLDDSVLSLQVPARALGVELYELLTQRLQLLEAEYFDLEYLNSEGIRCWLDHTKPFLKQVGLGTDATFRFSVRFYTPHPNLLEEEYTRYLFALQIKRDLYTGQLICSDNTSALLASFIVQAEIGDFVEEEFRDIGYLKTFKIFPEVNDERLAKVREFHRNHIGMSPCEADYKLLDTARKIEYYGIRMHLAKDHEGLHLNLSVAHMGIVVFQNLTKINTFSWSKIRKLSFKRKRFLIKLLPENFGYYKDTVEFYFASRDECKRFWKKCVEHHAFFRRQAGEHQVKRKRPLVVTKGSSYRYVGRTQKELVEYVRENIAKRPHFDRPSSARAIRTPQTQTRSLHLSRLHQRSNTDNCYSAPSRAISEGSDVPLSERLCGNSTRATRSSVPSPEMSKRLKQSLPNVKQNETCEKQPNGPSVPFLQQTENIDAKDKNISSPPVNHLTKQVLEDRRISSPCLVSEKSAKLLQMKRNYSTENQLSTSADISPQTPTSVAAGTDRNVDMTPLPLEEESDKTRIPDVRSKAHSPSSTSLMGLHNGSTLKETGLTMNGMGRIVCIEQYSSNDLSDVDEILQRAKCVNEESVMEKRSKSVPPEDMVHVDDDLGGDTPPYILLRRHTSRSRQTSKHASRELSPERLEGPSEVGSERQRRHKASSTKSGASSRGKRSRSNKSCTLPTSTGSVKESTARPSNRKTPNLAEGMRHSRSLDRRLHFLSAPPLYASQAGSLSQKGKGSENGSEVLRKQQLLNQERTTERETIEALKDELRMASNNQDSSMSNKGVNAAITNATPSSVTGDSKLFREDNVETRSTSSKSTVQSTFSSGQMRVPPSVSHFFTATRLPPANSFSAHDDSMSPLLESAPLFCRPTDLRSRRAIWETANGMAPTTTTVPSNVSTNVVTESTKISRKRSSLEEHDFDHCHHNLDSPLDLPPRNPEYLESSSSSGSVASHFSRPQSVSEMDLCIRTPSTGRRSFKRRRRNNGKRTSRSPGEDLGHLALTQSSSSVSLSLSFSSRSSDGFDFSSSCSSSCGSYSSSSLSDKMLTAASEEVLTKHNEIIHSNISPSHEVDVTTSSLEPSLRISDVNDEDDYANVDHEKLDDSHLDTTFQRQSLNDPSETFVEVVPEEDLGNSSLVVLQTEGDENTTVMITGESPLDLAASAEKFCDISSQHLVQDENVDQDDDVDVVATSEVPITNENSTNLLYRDSKQEEDIVQEVVEHHDLPSPSIELLQISDKEDLVVHCGAVSTDGATFIGPAVQTCVVKQWEDSVAMNDSLIYHDLPSSPPEHLKHSDSESSQISMGTLIEKTMQELVDDVLKVAVTIIEEDVVHEGNVNPYESDTLRSGVDHVVDDNQVYHVHISPSPSDGSSSPPSPISSEDENIKEQRREKLFNQRQSSPSNNKQCLRSSSSNSSTDDVTGTIIRRGEKGSSPTTSETRRETVENPVDEWEESGGDYEAKLEHSLSDLLDRLEKEGQDDNRKRGKNGKESPRLEKLNNANNAFKASHFSSFPHYSPVTMEMSATSLFVSAGIGGPVGSVLSGKALQEHLEHTLCFAGSSEECISGNEDNDTEEPSSRCGEEEEDDYVLPHTSSDDADDEEAEEAEDVDIEEPTNASNASKPKSSSFSKGGLNVSSEEDQSASASEGSIDIEPFPQPPCSLLKIKEEEEEDATSTNSDKWFGNSGPPVLSYTDETIHDVTPSTVTLTTNETDMPSPLTAPSFPTPVTHSPEKSGTSISTSPSQSSTSSSEIEKNPWLPAVNTHSSCNSMVISNACILEGLADDERRDLSHCEYFTIYNPSHQDENIEECESTLPPPILSNRDMLPSSSSLLSSLFSPLISPSNLRQNELNGCISVSSPVTIDDDKDESRNEID